MGGPKYSPFGALDSWTLWVYELLSILLIGQEDMDLAFRRSILGAMIWSLHKILCPALIWPHSPQY